MPEPLEVHRPLTSAPEQITSSDLNHLLDLLPDAVVVVNQEGVIVMVNRQSEAIFGYSREELRTQPLETLLPERFRTVHIAHRQRYFSALSTRPMGIGLQLFGLRKNGSEFPVDISLGPLLLDGRSHVVAAVRDVTEKQRLERERTQQVQYIRLQSELIDQAHDAILLRDPVNRVLLWNRGAEHLYGWTAQEALGRVTHTLLKTRFPVSLSILEAQLEREGMWEGELTHTCHNSKTVIVESRQVLVRDEKGQPTAILEINRDVTERRRMEQANQVAHATTIARLQFFQQILDALPIGVCLTYGPDARLLLANQSAGGVWRAGWQADQPMLTFLAANHIEITDDKGQPLLPEHFATLRALRRGETVLYQQEIIHYADGGSLPVLVNAIPLTTRVAPALTEHPLSADTSLALTIYQNVTTLKEAEYLKDEFIGIAAHELRTPLAVLQGYADTLLVQTARGHGSALAQWQQEALEEIKQATIRMTTLTEDLLDVTRLQAGRLRLQRVLTNIVPLVQRVVTHVQRRTTRHQLVVHATQQVLLADIDPQRIEQVVTNLLDNAVKYSPQGGTVTLMLREDSATQAVWVSVQDQGIGIPSHQQAQIFGRFVRAANAQAWGIHGTGLGLHLSRELVEQHGGQLWFKSEEGTGTTFFLTLPLVPGQVNDSGALLGGTEHEETNHHPPLSDRDSARKRDRSV